MPVTGDMAMAGFDFGGDEPTLYEGARLTATACGKGVSVGQWSTVSNSVLGNRVSVQRFCAIDACHIGDFTYTGRYTTLLHADIGSFCAISWGVSIGGANHDYRHVTMHDFTYNAAKGMVDGSTWGKRFEPPCVVGNDVWFGAGAIVNRGSVGIRIGDGAVVGAGAVVTHDVPPYAIVAGCPARVIGQRYTDDVISRMLAVQWWTFPTEVIRDNVGLFSLEAAEAIDLLEDIRRGLN